MNPFAPGAGTPPPALVGREPQLEAMRVLLARLGAGRPERSIVLCGLRGMGKTALLREMYRRAVQHGWRATYVEARPSLDLRATFVEQALEQLAGLSVTDKARATFDRALAFIKAVRAAARPGGVEVDVDPTLLAALGHSLEADLGALLSRLGEFARAQGIGVAFFCDELQELSSEAMEALCAAMHRVTQEQLPVALVAAGLPSLPGQLATAKSYAERLFSYPTVAALTPADVATALTDPLPEGVTVEKAALEAMVQYADGYPLLVQLVGTHAWNLAEGSTIRTQDVERAKPAAFASLSDELFLARWQRATPRERDYLRAVAGTAGTPPLVTRRGQPGSPTPPQPAPCAISSSARGCYGHQNEVRSPSRSRCSSALSTASRHSQNRVAASDPAQPPSSQANPARFRANGAAWRHELAHKLRDAAGLVERGDRAARVDI